MSDIVPKEENTTQIIAKPDVQGALEVMRAFQELKQKVLDANDVVTINGKQYIKRSGWRKIAMAFNISTEVVKIQREKIDNAYVVEVIARARTPMGRISEEAAVCDTTEFERGNLQGTLHNIETKAVTRAINRAISNLVGGGEVSAEEIIKGPDEVVREREIKEEPQQKEQQKDPPITTRQINYINDLMKDKDVQELVNKMLNGRKLSELTKSEASMIIEEIQKL